MHAGEKTLLKLKHYGKCVFLIIENLNSFIVLVSYELQTLLLQSIKDFTKE